MLENFINDYIWYHAFTIATFLVIATLIVVHRRGTEKNMLLAQDAKQSLHSFLEKTFDDYDGDLVVESPNIIKLYASGRESCLFAIFAFGVILF